MATNDLNIQQISTLVNSVVAQATGSALSTISGADFATVAQKGLKTGYDPLLNAIGQVLSKTIFSVRPYNRKFKGLNVSNQRWGNITRKIQVSDNNAEENDGYKLTDGESVDMYKVKKPNVLQTNFYGATTFQKQSPTIFRDQLDTAFSSPDEFAAFMSMLASNMQDQIEQAHESMARATIANLIGGRIAKNDRGTVVHLATEYRAAAGLEPETSVEAPEVYPAFIKWCYGRIAALSSMLTERSLLYHTNITGNPLMRHTPYDKQKVYLFAGDRYSIDSRVLADTYHDSYLKLADTETVNYWQSIATPDSINIKPVYLLDSGELQAAAAVEQSKVFGVIFDEEAAGYTVCNEWAQATPFNARGGYSNLFYHFTDRYWNDFTENAVVLLMD